MHNGYTSISGPCRRRERQAEHEGRTTQTHNHTCVGMLLWIRTWLAQTTSVMVAVCSSGRRRSAVLQRATWFGNPIDGLLNTIREVTSLRTVYWAPWPPSSLNWVAGFITRRRCALVPLGRLALSISEHNGVWLPLSFSLLGLLCAFAAADMVRFG